MRKAKLKVFSRLQSYPFLKIETAVTDVEITESITFEAVKSNQGFVTLAEKRSISVALVIYEKEVANFLGQKKARW